MEKRKLELWDSGEYSYPHAFGFVPNLHTYFHEDETVRPFFLIIPGGGYAYCSENEGELVARTFYEKGFQVAVLTYTTNFLYMEPLRDQPLKDAAQAVRAIRANAAAFHTYADRITLCGFSAGAHLAASLAEYHDTVEDSRYPNVSAAPDRLILAYPVITSGRFAHRHSFDALFGTNPTEEELDRMSLEKHVRPDMCPVFLWQTAEDASVPVENSYLMAMALREQNVPFEHHVFQHGPHGLSVATKEWEDRSCVDVYTLDQVREVISHLNDGSLIPSDPAAAAEQAGKFVNRLDPDFRESSGHSNREVAVWTDLAAGWIERSWR